MDDMVEGEVIIKTLCGVSQAQPIVTESKVSSLLKGHKFHKNCLYDWLQKGKVLNE